MNFYLKPTLEHIALVQVAATLWNQHDIRDLVRTYANSLSISDLGASENSLSIADLQFFLYPHFFSEKHSEWKPIEDRVTGNVADLVIATSLKEKLLGYIQPIGIQILRWIEYYFRFGNFDLNLLNNLCWTPHGTVDKKKTAEVLIKDEAIDITVRYKLACSNCLEDAIPKLWFELPESYKISFYDLENIENNFEKELLIFWGQYIRGNETSKDDMIGRLNRISFSDSFMLQCVSQAGNVAATKYFLKKQQKHPFDEIVLKTAIYTAKKCYKASFHHFNRPQEYCSEVFCFLLSQMNDEQQVQLFKECPIQTLQCLLDWPWQSFFVETASHLLNFFPDCYDVLKVIINKINIGYSNYCYKKIFQGVWQQIPPSQKSCMINSENFATVLQSFEDQEKIEFIFQNITFTERKNFFFSDRGLFFNNCLVYDEKWDLLKFWVHLCTTSKDEIIEFKKKFQNHKDLPLKKLFECDENKVEKFFQLLDDLIHGYGKRKKLDDGNSNSAKKLKNIKFKE